MSAKVVISTESFEELIDRLLPQRIVSISARLSFWSVSLEETSAELPSRDDSNLLAGIGIITFSIKFMDAEAKSVPVRFFTVRGLGTSAVYEYNNFVTSGREYCEELAAKLGISVDVSEPPELCGVFGGHNFDWFFAVADL